MSEWLTLNAPTILNGIASGLLLFCIAIGLSLIFGIMNVLNLAHGTFYLVGAYVAYAIVGQQVGTWMGFGLALAVAGLLGVGLGALMVALTRPLAGRGHLDQALLTLGIAFIVEDLLRTTFGPEDQSVAVPQSVALSVPLPDGTFPLYRLLVIAVGAAIAAAVWLVVERTTAGALMRAVVADHAMVQASGIDTRRVFVAVFAVGTALAMVGGVLGGPIRGASPGLDTEVLILALVVVVIGGLGSILGTLVAALFVGLVQNLGVALVPQAASFLLFGAMASIILFRPQGLLPRPGAVR